jgi:hypothetical protein
MEGKFKTSSKFHAKHLPFSSKLLLLQRHKSLKLESQKSKPTFITLHVARPFGPDVRFQGSPLKDGQQPCDHKQTNKWEKVEFASSRVRLLNTIIIAPPPPKRTVVGSQLTLPSETDLQKAQGLSGSLEDSACGFLTHCDREEKCLKRFWRIDTFLKLKKRMWFSEYRLSTCAPWQQPNSWTDNIHIRHFRLCPTQVDAQWIQINSYSFTRASTINSPKANFKVNTNKENKKKKTLQIDPTKQNYYFFEKD